MVGNRNPETKHRRGRTYMTTGHVAELCECAPRTVAQWCNNGLLKHHRLAGSSDRRIHPNDLYEFLKDCRNPIPDELFELISQAVLVISSNQETRSLLLACFDGPLVHLSASNAFEAGEKANRGGSLIAVVDLRDRWAEHVLDRLVERRAKIVTFGADQSPLKDNKDTEHFSRVDVDMISHMAKGLI